MCGVFGWISKDSRRLGRDRLIALTDEMKHRGPDAGGYELMEIDGGRASLGLGHRRLSILDLSSAGAQPMWSADRAYCVVFNGEIYNYLELREELAARGHVFSSGSDTEVLLEAYRAWGDACVTRFRGMFAFALYDSRDDSVFFARDPYGKKPLFFYRSGETLVFSSEIHAITRFPDFDSRFDWGSLDGYLVDRFVPGPATFFARIEKLPPGMRARWRSGRLTIERYYTPPLARRAPDIHTMADAAAQLRATLEEAVRLRLRCDAPFGAFLSGGLDSTAILALMAQNLPGPVKTFSADFTIDGYSEAKEAAEAARFFGAEHHPVEVGPKIFFDHWDEAVLRRGAPVSEGADIAILILSKAAGASVKMVLSGEGADEFFCGYPKYLAERYTALYHRFVGPGAHALLASIVDRVPDARRLKVLFKALSACDPSERARLWFGDMSRSEREMLLGRSSPAPCNPDFVLVGDGVSNVRRAQYFDQTCWLPDNTLERGDRMMMAGSVEGRMPFMDIEVAELAARIPDKVMMQGGVGKAVLRESMKDMLPAWVLRRAKNGFRVPFEHWLRGPHGETMRDLLLSEDSTTARLLHRPAIEKTVSAHMSGVADNSRILWSLMNLEKFLRVYKPDLSA